MRRLWNWLVWFFTAPPAPPDDFTDLDGPDGPHGRPTV